MVMPQPGAGASKYHSGCFSSVDRFSEGCCARSLVASPTFFWSHFLPCSLPSRYALQQFSKFENACAQHVTFPSTHLPRAVVVPLNSGCRPPVVCGTRGLSGRLIQRLCANIHDCINRASKQHALLEGNIVVAAIIERRPPQRTGYCDVL